MDAQVVANGYLQTIEHYRVLATLVGEEIKRALDEAGILATVAWRAKTVESVRGKVNRGFGARIESGLTLSEAMGDLAAVRICVYRSSDMQGALNLVQDRFQMVPGSVVDKTSERERLPEDQPKHWYRAVHAQVCLSETELRRSGRHFEGSQCEIQICSLFAHVWNEVDHDVRYKPRIAPSERMVRLLVDLGRLTQEGDDLINEVLAEFATHSASSKNRPLLSARDLETAVRQLQVIAPAMSVEAEPAAEIWSALYTAVHKAGLRSFGDLWDAIDSDLCCDADRWMGMLNEPSKAMVRKLGRAVVRVSHERYIWLREGTPSHRVLIALLPQLAGRFALQDSAIAQVARTSQRLGLAL